MPSNPVLPLGRYFPSFWEYITYMSSHVSDSNPANVLRITQSVASEPGDRVDAADRLTMIMEAEAIRNSVSGDNGEFGGEGSLEGLGFPLEDSEYLSLSEDGEETSDDPIHAGGATSARNVSQEIAAMHFLDTDKYVDHESGVHKPNLQFNQFEETASDLTPEDETLLGLDPYDE